MSLICSMVAITFFSVFIDSSMPTTRLQVTSAKVKVKATVHLLAKALDDIKATAMFHSKAKALVHNKAMAMVLIMVMHLYSLERVQVWL